MEQAQAKFEGWAIVELMGHQREIGFVTTQYFGGAAMFQIDSPELKDREYELDKPEWVDTPDGHYRMAAAGSKVKRPGVPAKSRLVSPAAIYALNPCTEETAHKAIERNAPRGLILLEVKEAKAALPGEVESVTGVVVDDLCQSCIDGNHDNCAGTGCLCDNPICDAKDEEPIEQETETQEQIQDGN